MNLAPVKRGDTWIFSFTWKNDGRPIDISDCTARMQIRKRRIGTLLAEVDSESGIIINGSIGKVTATFPASATSLVEVGTHETDLQLTFTTTGEVRSSQTISITVVEDITR
jgi:hypothetical protein